MESGCQAPHCEPTVSPEERNPDVLRAALVRETTERRRAECLANIQTEVVKFTHELLVREPDVEGFFRALTKTLVEEGEGHAGAVWRIDEENGRCELWMASFGGQVFTSKSSEWNTMPFPREAMATHLFNYKPGWVETIEYGREDSRLPESVREFINHKALHAVVVAPLVLAGRSLGWVTLCTAETAKDEEQWWRVPLVEAIAHQAALALHLSRLNELNRVEERRKAILEERNRLARDIHDTLAQGFAAILMQLQAAQREVCPLTAAVGKSLETAVELARTHLAEARRSVGALRPNVGRGEDVASAIKRLADLGQKTTTVPIEVVLDELPRFGDGVEREIIGIAQEALTNAVRHARARRITIKASTVKSLGLRLSVADDGRGIAREQSTSGFGMTSMQERAERIGASLTIVTAPRSGTEVVLAWEPTSLPTQVYAAN
jgi:signal transduction histidine kinase